MENKDKKKKKPIRIILDVAFFSIIGFMVLCFTWNFIDIKSGYKYPLFGLRTTVIVSPSMATINESNDYITSDMKQIQKYDVITTANYKSFDDIKIYDVATYFAGNNELICHRVVNKYIGENGTKYVVFRGDANNVDDAPVSYELVRGKVVTVTPKIGHIVAFIQSPYVFIAIFGTAFFVALGLFIIGLGKGKKKETQPDQPVEEKKEASIEEIQKEETKE